MITDISFLGVYGCLQLVVLSDVNASQLRKAGTGLYNLKT